MDQVRTARRPWRPWTVIAVVLTVLALAQACGQSGSNTGPTTSAALQLKLRRAGAAQLPAGCSGTYSVTGPGVSIANQALPPDGKITFQGQVGQTYTVAVALDCGPQGQFSGSTTIEIQPGVNQAEIVLNTTQALGASCSPSTVDPGQPSSCTCNIQSATPPTVTWTGSVSPKSGPTTTFRNSTPGTYTVSCTVNNIATRSTSVTVKAPDAPTTGTIVISNEDDDLQMRATFSGGPQAVPQIGSLNPGGSATRTVLAGTYNVTIEFDFEGFGFCTSDSITVGVNQVKAQGYDTGDCD